MERQSFGAADHHDSRFGYSANSGFPAVLTTTLLLFYEAKQLAGAASVQT